MVLMFLGVSGFEKVRVGRKSRARLGNYASVSYGPPASPPWLNATVRIVGDPRCRPGRPGGGI